MKNSLKHLMIVTFVLLSTTIHAQIKNAKTETVKVYGNCGMCKTKIENAGNMKNTAKVDWNKDTKMAMVTYDANKTNTDEMLKRIALAGYDSDSFLAPKNTYENLPGCCQYDRVAKTPVKGEMEAEMNMESNQEGHNHADMMAEMKGKHEEMKDEMKAKMESKHADMMAEMKEKMESNHKEMKSSETQKSNQLDAVYENYFAIKDALVKTDGKSASTNATALLESLNAVKMGELKMDVHMVWMKVMKDLKDDATKISSSTDAKKQRDSFDTLSENIYKLIKVSKTDSTVYFQHCPMANDGKGANWLSKENTIKNPYFGSIMLNCGNTIETIK